MSPRLSPRAKYAAFALAALFILAFLYQARGPLDTIYRSTDFLDSLKSQQSDSKSNSSSLADSEPVNPSPAPLWPSRRPRPSASPLPHNPALWDENLDPAPTPSTSQKVHSSLPVASKPKSKPKPKPKPKPVALPVSCDIDGAALRLVTNAKKVRYGRLHFDVVTCESLDECSLDVLPLSIPKLQEVPLDDLQHPYSLSEGICPTPFQIKLPAIPPRPDASNLFFGAATNINRLNESLEQFPHWIANTGARLLAIIEPTTAEKIEEIESKAEALGINLEIEQSEAEFNDRYYALTKAIYEKRTKNTQWAAIIDDDTFFPSIGALLKALAVFDPTKGHYTGGLTEDLLQTHNFGYMAYGGAGVFLTVPLLKDMIRVYQKCYDNKATGDRRIADCVHQHSIVKFTPNPLFHQLDMRGDLSGFYESGRPQPLSIHHWKSWHQTNMTALFGVASVTGDDYLLQRWRLNDGWFLTNGYSIVKYSTDLDETDITMENSWDGGGDYSHSMDPMRPRDEKKLSFRLEVTMEEDDGQVRQFFIKRTKDQDEEILEVVWRRT